MPDALDHLDRHFALLTRRRNEWISAPGLVALAYAPGKAEGHSGALGELVLAVNDDTSAPERSGQAVRALAAVGAHEPVALVVLLHALAPRLRARLRRAVSAEHVDDALGDLVFVITDATATGELDHLTGLAHRLVNRAHNRTHKRSSRYDLTRSPQLIDSTAASMLPDIAEVVTARLDLTRFAGSVERAIAAGEVSPRGWDAYRHQRLARSLTGGLPRASVNDRNLASSMNGNGNGHHDSPELPRGDAESIRLRKIVDELIELFNAYDRPGLARLSPQERKEQLDARAAVYRYTGQLYHRIKHEQGLDPKYDPELAILGVYRDLLGALGDAAVEVRMQRRDEDSATS